MPFVYRIDPERRLVVSTGDGVVTTGELLEHETSLAADPAFDPGFDQLADFMNVTDISVSMDDVRPLAAAGPWSGTSRRAGCFGKAYIFGMARMYEVICEMRGIHFRAFRSRDEAEGWLRGPSETMAGDRPA